MILYIDHYDSFTNTIVDYISHLGYLVTVKKTNDEIINIEKYSHIIIGPGPGHPSELLNQYTIIKYCEDYNVPLLGICLGHQLIAQYYGANIKKAKQIFHGKTSVIVQTYNSCIYEELPKNFEVTRYHSLIVENISSPLITTAVTSDNEIMSFEHEYKKIYAIQYHPEAYLTEYGLNILKNFLSKNTKS